MIDDGDEEWRKKWKKMRFFAPCPMLMLDSVKKFLLFDSAQGLRATPNKDGRTKGKSCWNKCKRKKFNGAEKALRFCQVKCFIFMPDILRNFLSIFETFHHHPKNLFFYSLLSVGHANAERRLSSKIKRAPINQIWDGDFDSFFCLHTSSRCRHQRTSVKFNHVNMKKNQI